MLASFRSGCTGAEPSVKFDTQMDGWNRGGMFFFPLALRTSSVHASPSVLLLTSEVVWSHRAHMHGLLSQREDAQEEGFTGRL